jgi:methyl-accepting chemotaxis protein
MATLAAWRHARSIRTKILLACATLAVVTAVVGAWGLWAFSRANAAFTIAATESLPAVDHLLQADRDMQYALASERSLMFLKWGTPDAEAQRRAHEQAVRNVGERWQRYTAIAAGADERKRWHDFEAAWADWRAVTDETVKLLSEDTASSRRDAIDLTIGDGAAKFERARKILTDLSQMRLAAADRHARAEQQWAARARWWVIGAVLGAFGLACVLGLTLGRWVAAPLRATVTLLRDVAEGEGDLTKRLEVNTGDEVGQMARWFNTFMDRLHDLIGQVRQAADQVALASQQLSSSTGQLAGGVQEQAGSLEETAASLEEITGTVKQTADNARQANQLARASRETAEKGGEVVTTAVAAMGEINRASKRIADIITTIDEIAFQTNLLALNAAVEAARAGEQGRGFAVVAAEVRSLAQRSATAAREIKALIQDSVGKVEAGSALVDQSGQTLGEIVESVKRATDIIAEIAAASQEQSSGIDQVNRAVAQMDHVVQSNAAQTEELSSTARLLAGQASSLQSLVGRFRLDTGEVAAVAGTPAPAAPAVAIAPAAPAVAAAPPRAAAGAPAPVRRARVTSSAPATPRPDQAARGHDGFEEF